MTIGNTTQLAELINRVWQGGPWVDLVSRDDFFMKRFPQVSGAGDGVRWKVIADSKNTSAASYSESDTLPTAVAHTFLSAKLSWKYVWVGIEVTGQTQAQVKGEGGFEGYRDALATEVEQSVLDLKNKIEVMIKATTLASSTDIDGIGIPVLDTTSYAAIDPATYTEWASYKNSTGGALTIAIMQDVKTKVEDDPRYGNVSVITTGPAQWNAYGNLVSAQRRFTPMQTLDGGFQALDFEGVPVTKVPAHVTGRMYFLSEKDAKGKANFQYVNLQPFKTLDKSGSKADSMYFLITHYAQLQCRNRRSQGYATGLS